MESLPSERGPKEMDIDEQSGAEQDPAKLENNIQEQDSPSHASQKSPPKNGIPPRRLSSMTKRAVPSTPTPTSRSNPVTSSRTAPGTSLNKPPTRPLASSSSRRLTTKSAASTPASSAPKKRPSANQSDKKGKDDISASDENTKPVGNKLETRRFGHSKGDSKTSSDNNNQNKAKLEHISETGQPSASTPNKPLLRSTTNSSRPSAVQSTPRHNHPATSSTRRIQGAAGPEANRKRLSTIPASPAPARDDSTPSASAPLTPSSSRATRPMMLTRKSTMSVTIEQRLREMELVHQMIHIAMAEDGDESDEAKEEYGRKVDESLASLRIRLEEARRNEGLVDTEAVQSQLNGFPEEEKSGGAMALSTANIDELQKSLPESLNKVYLNIKEASSSELNPLMCYTGVI